MQSRYKTIENTAAASETPPKSRGGAPKGNKNAAKHRNYARKAALADVGFAGIDKRTTAGRVYVEKREQIYTDRGGKDALSQMELDLVEKYMRLSVLIDSLYAFARREYPTTVAKMEAGAASVTEHVSTDPPVYGRQS